AGARSGAPVELADAGHTLRPKQESDEAATGLLETGNTGHTIIRRPHDPLVMFHHVVDHLIVGHRRNRVAIGAARVFGDDATGSHPNIVEGLFPRLCHVTPYGQPPIPPPHRLAVRGGPP